MTTLPRPGPVPRPVMVGRDLFGSLREAAEALGVSQPWVSQALLRGRRIKGMKITRVSTMPDKPDVREVEKQLERAERFRATTVVVNTDQLRDLLRYVAKLEREGEGK